MLSVGVPCPYRKIHPRQKSEPRTRKMNAKQPEIAEVREPKGPGGGWCKVASSQNQQKTWRLPTKPLIGLNLKGNFEGTNGRRRKSGSPAEFVDQTIHVGNGHEFAAGGFFGDVTRIRLRSGDGLNASVRSVGVKISLVIPNHPLHMAHVEKQEVVEALPAQAALIALHDGVCFGRPVGRPDSRDAHGFLQPKVQPIAVFSALTHHGVGEVAEDAVVVVHDEARLFVVPQILS